MKPFITTQRDLIRALPEKWRKTYPDGGYMGHKHVQAELDKLDLETVTAETVDAIIGNTSWTTCLCDACREYVTAWVTVGQERDCESNTADLCFACLRQAAELLPPQVGT